MTWYHCRACDGKFQAPFTYSLYELQCPKCTKKGQAQIYTGDVRALILKDEDEKVERLKLELEEIKVLKTECLQELANLQNKITAELKTLGAADLMGKIEGLKTAMSMLDEASSEISSQIKDLLGSNRSALKSGATKVYEDAYKVKSTSKKNKLYIGSRQYVARCVQGSTFKKKRILDSNVWTWGLNASWVEGGVNAKAKFTMKVNSDNQYECMPGAVMQWLEQKTQKVLDDESAAALASEFLTQCEQHGKGSLLWYDKGGENRPTWTALEMAILLSRGYRFRFPEGSSRTKPSKLYLIPPS